MIRPLSSSLISSSRIGFYEEAPASIARERVADRVQLGGGLRDFECRSDVPHAIADQQTIMTMVHLVGTEMAQDLPVVVPKHNDRRLCHDRRRLGHSASLFIPG